MKLKPPITRATPKGKGIIAVKRAKSGRSTQAVSGALTTRKMELQGLLPVKSQKSV